MAYTLTGGGVVAVTHDDEIPPLPPHWAGEPRLIIFFIPTPVPLALPQGSTFAFTRDEEVPWMQGVATSPAPGVEPRYVDPEGEKGGFVSLKVWRLPERLALDTTQVGRALRAYKWMVDPDGRDRGDPMPEPSEQPGFDSETTVFEAVTPLIPAHVKGEIDTSRSISDAFDRCIESLERLYRAYIVSEHDWRVQILTRRSISSVIPWTTVDPFDKRFGSEGLFLTNEGETDSVASTDTMDEERVHRMMVFLQRRGYAGESGDPVAVALAHKRRAQRAYHVEADYQACLAWSYARGETLLDGLLLMSAWEERVSAGEAAGWFNGGLAARIGARYSSRFGGQWDLTLADTPLGIWRSSVQELRHKVVHDGYRPSETEARDALDASDGLEEFLFERLAVKRKAFPRTALLWFGVPGLERRGLYDKHIREIAEGSDGDEPWLAQYRDYVAEVRRLWRYR